MTDSFRDNSSALLVIHRGESLHLQTILPPSLANLIRVMLAGVDASGERHWLKRKALADKLILELESLETYFKRFKRVIADLVPDDAGLRLLSVENPFETLRGGGIRLRRDWDFELFDLTNDPPPDPGG